MEGPQGYGRTAADDAGFEAASRTRAPAPCTRAVVAQRRDGLDKKAPAFACTLRGALDALGNLVGFDYMARAATTTTSATTNRTPC